MIRIRIDTSSGKRFPPGGRCRPDYLSRALSILCRAKPFPARGLRLSHCPFVNLLACTYSPTTYSRLPGYACAARILCAQLPLTRDSTRGFSPRVFELLRGMAASQACGWMQV
ncbi:hypothetical protein EVAR_59909_1 [Eumeta japonica]|uniref:Uncharacterized protein n=1 Tax=Eumeta variegata TaxID=151549 RepID=A0A4C2AGY6_EUMVA|nr:hypothetical protein EVAR_59909_1 [Eumeta japonica]